MDHVVILKSSWNLLPKIINGEKTVESRWYKSRFAPWDRVERGDTIYFKDSGRPVTVRADVTEVKQYEVRSNDHALEMLREQAKGLGVKNISIFDHVRDKNYAIFVSFNNVEEVEPFKINKGGFGVMAAWLVVEDINNIKR